MVVSMNFMRSVSLFVLMLCSNLMLAQETDYKPMAYSTSGYATSKTSFITRLKPVYLDQDKKYKEGWDDFLYDRYQEYSAAAKQKMFITEAFVINYCKSVLQPILDSNKIKTKIDIICTRSVEVNAFNMGDNRIYVNIGILSVLDNEAQLAFLLCHELSHQLLMHAQQKFRTHVALVQDKNIKKEIRDIRKAKYNKMDRATQFALKYGYAQARYNRDMERAADSMAMVLLQKTSYDIAEGIQLMNILQASDTDTIRINYSTVFSGTNGSLKPEWTDSLQSLISFGRKEAIEYSKDSLNTHPDIPERISYIRQNVKQMKRSNAVAHFLISKNTFDSVKTGARYEVLESYGTNARYAAVFYHSLHMLQQEPQNAHLIKKSAYALHNLVMAVKNHTIQDHIPVESDDNSLAYNQLLRIIDRTTLEELTQLYKNYIGHYPELNNITALQNFNETAKKE